MRIRSVKPDFYRDELTGQMDAEHALFYLGVCNFCDDHGRFTWNPVLLASDLDPYAAKWGGAQRVGELLEELLQAGRLVRYQVDGKVFGWMPSFLTHQKPSHPLSSRIPPPPEDYGNLPQHSENVSLEREKEREGEHGERGSAETVESTVPSRGQVLPLVKGGR